MKTYLVPMYNLSDNQVKNHLALIKAKDKYQAMLIAIGSHNYQTSEDGYSIELSNEDDRKWIIDRNYNSYKEYTDSSSMFTNPDDNDKMDLSNMEDDHMELYDYMYWGNYNAQIQTLAEKALTEKWSFEERNDNSILKNYLKYTFNKLQDEGKVIETDSYCVFNTGLFSNYQVPIYAYGEIYKNGKENSPKWYFRGFKDEYELGKLDLETKSPERADYFSDPQRLVFNWHNKVIVNNRHILDDLNTNKRLPESIKTSKRPLEDLNGVINTAIQKVIANYKLAIPHYYQDKIQLLIPLSFDNGDKPDVALVIDQLKNGDYLATTCLTLEMAYMDARLIAKPESNWLVADNIPQTEEN